MLVRYHYVSGEGHLDALKLFKVLYMGHEGVNSNSKNPKEADREESDLVSHLLSTHRSYCVGDREGEENEGSRKRKRKIGGGKEIGGEEEGGHAERKRRKEERTRRDEETEQDK
jgi:hypothetical protein